MVGYFPCKKEMRVRFPLVSIVFKKNYNQYTPLVQWTKMLGFDNFNKNLKLGETKRRMFESFGEYLLWQLKQVQALRC